MSSQNGNEQEMAYSNPESGTNAENDKQPKKMKPPTAFVQIGLAEPTNGPMKVELGQNCSTVAEHAAFLLAKINQSQGNLIGLQLNGPVALAAVSKDDVFLMNGHDVPLEVDHNYTFLFKLANVHVKKEMEEDVPGQVEELAKQLAQMAKEKEELTNLMSEQAEKMAHSVEELTKEKNTLKRKVEELEKEAEKHQKQLEEAEAKAKLEEEKRMAPILEYAHLIGVPTVANLKSNYDKEKLLQLIQHGNIPSIYVQSYQQLKDAGLLQSIVDLLATAEKSAQLVGEVTIEFGSVCFFWPKREELKLKCKTSNVPITFNGASASPESSSGRCLAEYELANRGRLFQVLIYYWVENDYNKWVVNFVYRRLP